MPLGKENMGRTSCGRAKSWWSRRGKRSSTSFLYHVGKCVWDVWVVCVGVVSSDRRYWQVPAQFVGGRFLSASDGEGFGRDATHAPTSLEGHLTQPQWRPRLAVRQEELPLPRAPLPERHALLQHPILPCAGRGRRRRRRRRAFVVSVRVVVVLRAEGRGQLALGGADEAEARDGAVLIVAGFVFFGGGWVGGWRLLRVC
jgi:hypothetical protein